MQRTRRLASGSAAHATPRLRLRALRLRVSPGRWLRAPRTIGSRLRRAGGGAVRREEESEGRSEVARREAHTAHGCVSPSVAASPRPSKPSRNSRNSWCQAWHFEILGARARQDEYNLASRHCCPATRQRSARARREQSARMRKEAAGGRASVHVGVVAYEALYCRESARKRKRTRP